MIHFRADGEFIRVGLNIHISRSNLSVIWAWFDFAKHEGWCRGFALSKRGFRGRNERWNVIESYMRLRGMEMVHRETLHDLKEIEEDVRRHNNQVLYLIHYQGVSPVDAKIH